MSAPSRWWTSPDGKRTIDLAVVADTFREGAFLYISDKLLKSTLGESCELHREVADSFLASLTAWRQAQEKPYDWSAIEAGSIISTRVGASRRQSADDCLAHGQEQPSLKDCQERLP